MAKKYTEEQIHHRAQEGGAVAKVGDLCRKAWDERCHLLQLESFTYRYFVGLEQQDVLSHTESI